MKSYIKQLITMLLLAFFAMAGCKKEGSSGSGKYYVKFKANGAQQELRSKVGGNRMGAEISGPLNRYSGVSTWLFEMAGYGADREPYPSLLMTIQSSAAITTNKTYKTVSENIPVNGQAELFFNEKVETAERVINYITSENVQITITEISDEGCRGTFSGTVKSADGTKQSVLTDGEFYVQRLN